MNMLARIAAMGGSAAVQTYVDDVFSAYSYAGTSASQTIANGIDLAGKGGLVWVKARNSATYWNVLFDTARGGGQLSSNNTDASLPSGSNIAGYVSYNSGGFTTQSGSSGFGSVGLSGNNYVSLTFRKAAKFFDVATVTKSAGSNATASFPDLSTLGMVVVKRTDSAGSWYVWHRSLTAGKLLYLEQAAAEATLGHITVSGTTVTLVNGTIANGSYVVYAWAHDSAADGLIQCGGYSGDGVTGHAITLGWEPQFVMVKEIGGADDWYVFNANTEMSVTNSRYLVANTSAAEANATVPMVWPIATGFALRNSSGINSVGESLIYLAIRRPNKPPASGSEVYQPTAYTGTSATSTIGTLYADLQITVKRSGIGHGFYDRLRGVSAQLVTASYGGQNGTSAEYNRGAITANGFARMGGVEVSAGGGYCDVTAYIQHLFRRAPGVFDTVCYAGTTSAGLNISHGLGVVPEMFIVKSRSASGSWGVYHKDVGNDRALFVDQTAAKSASSSTYWNSTTPTASVFTLGNSTVGNAAQNYVAYLFATKEGVSKVGSYTGNGSTQTIDCGFASGARFVLIKRTDSTGDWLVWDTARGIIASSDPHLSLNTETAEVTTDDSLDPDSSGFIVNTAPNINVNNATYIFLAFA